MFNIGLISKEYLTQIASVLRSVFSTSATFTLSDIADFCLTNTASLITKNIKFLYNKDSSISGAAKFSSCRDLKMAAFPNCVNIGNHTSTAWSSDESAFYYCTNLSYVYLPNCTTIGNQTFQGAGNISTGLSINAPKLTTLGGCAFQNSKLITADFPLVSFVGQECFRGAILLKYAFLPLLSGSVYNRLFFGCSNLSIVRLGNVAWFAPSDDNGHIFGNCYNLVSLYLTQCSSVPTLTQSQAFNSTPIAGYSGSTSSSAHIYVPASLLTAFQSATNWVYFSDKMIGV